MEQRTDDLKAVSALANSLLETTQSSNKSIESIETVIAKIADILCLDLSKVQRPSSQVEIYTNYQPVSNTEELNEIDKIAEENRNLLMDIQRTEALTLRFKQLLQENQKIFTLLAEWVKSEYGDYRKDKRELLQAKVEENLELTDTSRWNLWYALQSADQDITRLGGIINDLNKILSQSRDRQT